MKDYRTPEVYLFRRNKTVRGGVNEPSKAIPRKRDLPQDIRQCIKGKVIDLSTASKYWEKCARAALPRIEPLVKWQDTHRLEFMDSSLFAFFLNLIKRQAASYHPKTLQEIHPNMSSGDWVARFLYDASHLFGRTDQKPREPSPYLLWPADRPVSDAWQGLGSLSPLFFGNWGVVLEDPGSGSELRLPRPGECLHPRIEMKVRYGRDRQELPKMTIELEGELVCILMKAPYVPRDPVEQRTIRKEADRIWTSLSKYLTNKKSKGGRPGQGKGIEAARLHYHEGLSWTRVADKLCLKHNLHQPPSRKTHMPQCKENFRKQAEQFFRRITEHIKTLPQARAEE